MDEFALPSRRLFVADRWARSKLIDHETGFLKESAVASTWSMRDLLARQAVLVLGPPWMGKTYVADRTEAALRGVASTVELPSNEAGDNALAEARPAGAAIEFGRRVILTKFEERGNSPIGVPTWWEEWKTSRSRACWIVDALDEDKRRGNHAWDILEHIKALDASTRRRLSLILFCRENEQAPKFVAALSGLYPDDPSEPDARLLTVMLAPLDTENAREYVGDSEKFELILKLIKEHQLQSIAGRPKPLGALKKFAAQEGVTARDVWKSVIDDLIEEPRLDRHELAGSADDLFWAAARIATVATFEGLKAVDRGYGEAVGPDASQLVSAHAQRCAQQKRALREVLKSGVFARVNEGYVIRQDHVREWLAAFGLQEVGVKQVRRLLADGGDRMYGAHAGVSAALWQISSHREVRDWINERNGGVPPIFDAGALTLEMAEAHLDRMLEVARQPEHGIGVWDIDFRVLDVAGIGGAIRSRLEAPNRTFGEKQLLIEAAKDLHASECAGVAVRMVRDESEAAETRVSAAYLLCMIGSAEVLRQLDEFARSSETETHEQRSIVCALALGMLRHGMWSFRDAWERWRACNRGSADVGTVLGIELKERMGADDARWLLKRWDWDEARQSLDGRNAWRDAEWLEHAMDRIGVFTADEYRLLWPLMFFDHGGGDYSSVIERAFGLLQSDVESRRALFAEAVKRNPDGKSRLRCPWGSIIKEDDAEWVANLAKSFGASSSWLWEFVLRLAERVGGERSDCLRELVRAVQPNIVTEFDEVRRAAQQQEKQWKIMQQARAREGPRQYRLDELVTRYLGDERATSCQKMYALARVCNDESHLRPKNVTGSWSDLSDELRRNVVAAFSEALRDCPRTEIPDSDSYPATLMWEAVAFTYAVRFSAFYEPDAEQIRKWLPCTLAFGHSEPMAVVAKCLECDRAATEDVIFNEIVRELRIRREEPFSIYRVPETCWTATLAERLADRLSDEKLQITGRCRILRLLSRVAPSFVEPIARRWAALEPSAKDAEREKRTAGIDALLRIDAAAGLSELEREDKAVLPAVVEKLGALVSELRRTNESVREWAPAYLERLYAILEVAFPAETDPKHKPGTAWTAGRDEDLRELRWAIVAWLFDRGGVDETAALERLAGRYELVGKWYAWKRGNATAKGIVESVSEFVSQRQRDAGYVHYQDVVRLLDDAEYRIIRGEADLLDVIREQIECIARSANKHLSMLYESAAKRGTTPKRLHEKALQAYLHCRLMDLLPKRGERYFANREPVKGEGERTDITVEAKTIDSDKACVIIEVKWSNNPDVATEFENQLVKRYLQQGEGEEKAGLYLVGWCGASKWPGLGKAGVEGLKAKLADQTTDLRSRYPGLHLEASVLDVQWPEKGENGASKRKRTNSPRKPKGGGAGTRRAESKRAARGGRKARRRRKRS